MARFAPLPSVSIDPRNETQLVQQASQAVYQASNQTLNDFSSGNPLAALLEGQVFAQGEFLFWANQLPQSILIEWIGPFLGAMRRLGTAATAQLEISISPGNTNVIIPAATSFSTDSNLTGGQSYTFVTLTEVNIPAGETLVKVPVVSQSVGSQYNVPSNSITVTSTTDVPGLIATNPLPAVGGSDVESYDEVQQRFFTLIRRKNPVSSQDWQDFFEDLIGVGTLTSVQPNRPNSGVYEYRQDYLEPDGQVSFFVLGPNGTELTETQIKLAQNVVDFSVPVENKGHVYPVTLSQVQYNINLEVDANSSYGRNLRETALNFRDRLAFVLQPGTAFPANVDPTVSDVDSAFYSTFDSSVRFVNPHVEVSSAYNTPVYLQPSSATYTQVYTFEPTQNLLNSRDLVLTDLPVPAYYPVISSFTPYSTVKKDQTLYGNLKLQQIKYLTSGSYLQGEVGYWDTSIGGDGQLHAILENLTISSQNDIASLITQGKVSAALAYSPWVVGNSYVYQVAGAYSPEIIQYDYSSGDFIPSTPSTIAQNKRPGTFIWVTSNNFTLGTSTTSVTGAQVAGLLGASITPQPFLQGSTYAAGTWVITPQIGSGPTPVADPYYNYVDAKKGLVNKYAYVVSAFTCDLQELTVSEYFDSLVAQGVLQEVVVRNADAGLPVYKYKARFTPCTPLKYQADSLSSADYYFSAFYFTPTSTNVQTLINRGEVFPLYIDETQKAEYLSSLRLNTVTTPVKMFRFFKGERTFLRRGSTITSYTATTSVSPLFDFQVYLANGVFIPTPDTQISQFSNEVYIPLFNPAYDLHSEDTVLSADGRNMYRVIRAFTPGLTVTNWTDTSVGNTARIEEYEGNLLRYVSKYECEQDILSQLGRDISAIKLGVAQITLIPKNQGRVANSNPNIVFVWENTSSLSEVPELSWYTGTTYAYTPPDYGTGTLGL